MDGPNPNNMSIRRMMHLPSVIHVYALFHHPKKPNLITTKRIQIAFERMKKRPGENAKIEAITAHADRNWLSMGFVVPQTLAEETRFVMPSDIASIEPNFGLTAKTNQQKSETIEQWLHNHLYQNGMLPQQAQAVIDSITDPAFVSVKNSAPHRLSIAAWKELFFLVDKAATKWIDANTPKAWYRTIFRWLIS